MEKKLNKPYSRNIRLDKPCGLIGVPPDAAFYSIRKPVMIVAQITDAQYNAMVNVLSETEHINISQ